MVRAEDDQKISSNVIEGASEAMPTLGRRGVLARLLGGSAALGGVVLASPAPAAASAPPVEGPFVAKSVMPVNVKDHGAKGDGETDDSEAVQDAITAAEEDGRSVFFPAGTYVVSSPWRADGPITLRGEGMSHTTVAVHAPAGFVDLGTHARALYVEDMAFDNLGNDQSAIDIDGSFIHEFAFRRCRFVNLGGPNGARASVELFNVGTGEFVDCLWHNPAAYAGQGTAVRVQGRSTEAGGRQETGTGGKKLRFAGNNRILWVNNGIRVQPQIFQHRGADVGHPPALLQNLEVDGAYFDGFWWLLPAAHSGEGPGVTYGETSLSDPSADFTDPPLDINIPPGLGPRPNVLNVRAMPVRQTGQVSSATATRLVDENADFVEAGVKRMDIVRSSGRWAVVAVEPISTVNPNAVQVEEWLDDETLLPTEPPNPGADYTIYGVIFGEIVAATATTLTLRSDWPWRDLYGNVVTPEDGTRYEILPIRPTYLLFTGPGGVRNLRLTNSTLRRGWADMAGLRSQQNQIIGNLFEDGQELGLTVSRGGYPGHFIIGNHFRHIGHFAVFLNQTEAVVIGNRAEGSSWKEDNDTYADFALINAQRCHVAHNISVAGPETKGRNACVAIRHQRNFTEPTQPEESTGNVLLYNRRYGHDPDEPDVRVLPVAGASPDDIGDNEIIGSRTIVLQGGAPAQHVEIRGTGSPEGVVPATSGSTFLRSDGGAGSSLYVKESGTGTTGWVAK